MRIITGIAKGKRLEALPGEATRPTSDRIKEAIFSSIQFDMENRRVLDLFAGTGQLGLEALSRGAASAFFVDSEREAIELVKKNANFTGLSPMCKYLVSDWRNYIRKASGREMFDLVFVDPPYAMECCADAAERLLKAELLAPGAIVVLESGTESLDLTEFPEFQILKSTSYGKKTSVNILLYKG